MDGGILPAFEVLGKLAGDVLPKWLPVLLAASYVLALKQRHLQAHLLLEDRE